MDEFFAWLTAQAKRVSRKSDLGEAMAYMLKRQSGFRLFLEDGRVDMDSNLVENAIRSPTLGRKSWLFAGSERGGDRAAFMYTLIVTAKMNDIDPQAWMADVLARLPNITVSRVHELLPWNWKAEVKAVKAA